MQTEIRKKTLVNGIAAILLTIVLTTVCYQFGIQPSFQPLSLELKTFSSYDELENFLRTNMENARYFEELYLTPFIGSGEVDLINPPPKASTDYSTTNIQVAGVDEADIIKTDGSYLYVVSSNTVYILKAYPPEQAEVLSKITLNETDNIEIYVKEDKLAVLQNYYTFKVLENSDTHPSSGDSFIKIYDISDKSNPVLTKNISLVGTLSSSRMLGNYIYAVVSQPAMKQSSNGTDFEVILPKIYTDSVVEEVNPTEISYVDISDIFYYFTTVVAINIIDDTQATTYESFLTGSTSSIYVSLSNMYLTVPNTNAWFSFDVGVAREETLIYKVKLDEEKIVLDAEGNVAGYVLNQFSMDEFQGFFRVATTEWSGEGPKNNLFILDMNLNIVGELENIAQGERIYSARFISDRCYLVTFKQIDPFFVIDISNPTDPKILGELKIPGFSSYLHPYDENHVIGIGKQDNNVKLSLFNVTNVNTPIEAAEPYIVQGEWSDSTVLMDHKAFLFDKSKQLLVLPLSIQEGDDYINGFWQGAYIFNITLSNGFVLKGNVTHQENSTDQWDTEHWIVRTLYIDDVLYTISERKIKMNSIENLDLLQQIELS